MAARIRVARSPRPARPRAAAGRHLLEHRHGEMADHQRRRPAPQTSSSGRAPPARSPAISATSGTTPTLEPSAVTTFAMSVSHAARIVVDDVDAVGVARRRPGSPRDDDREADQDEQRRPRAPPSGVVNSSPSPPGVSRCQRNRACGSIRRPSATSGRSTAAPSIRRASRSRFSRTAHEPDRERRSRRRSRRRRRRRRCPGSASSVAWSMFSRGEVAEQREGRRPQPGAEHAVGQERPVRHPRAAGDERRQRADQADEAPDQDRLAAVAVRSTPRPARSAPR